MPKNLLGKSIMTLKDFSREEIEYLLDLSAELKADKMSGRSHKYLEGKNVALLFQKDSTRTRSAFEVGAFDLGMNVTFIGPSGAHMGTKETTKDTARVLGRIYDGISFRGYSNKDTMDLIEHSGIPVWNALDDLWHPSQVLADFLTIKEHLGTYKVKLAFLGDPKNNMGRSLMVIAAKLGASFVGVGPKEDWPPADLIKEMQDVAKTNGGTIEFEEDPIKGTKGADVVYTDVWVSMGDPAEAWEERTKSMVPYRVTKEIMDNAGKDAIFLHCLPAFHNNETKTSQEKSKLYKTISNGEMEVTDEVFESQASKVFDEAENRLHTAKAMMLASLGTH